MRLVFHAFRPKLLACIERNTAPEFPTAAEQTSHQLYAGADLERNAAMSNKTLTVAKELLDRLNRVNPSVTPMQLLKLVYVAHGYMLGIHGRPLLDEEVEAWQYGPVVRSVFDAVKRYRSNPIEKITVRSPVDLDSDEVAVLDRVARNYGKHSGVTLSSATHKPGTPWSVTWGMGDGKNSVISNDVIEEFYDRLLKQGKHSTL